MNRLKILAYQASIGSVSGFLQRYLTDHPEHTWAQIKMELATRFAEVTDSQHALMLLRKVKLRPEENVQVYAERLLELADDAFQGQGQDLPD